MAPKWYRFKHLHIPRVPRLSGSLTRRMPRHHHSNGCQWEYLRWCSPHFVFKKSPRGACFGLFPFKILFFKDHHLKTPKTSSDICRFTVIFRSFQIQSGKPQPAQRHSPATDPAFGSAGCATKHPGRRHKPSSSSSPNLPGPGLLSPSAVLFRRFFSLALSHRG